MQTVALWIKSAKGWRTYAFGLVAILFFVAGLLSVPSFIGIDNAHATNAAGACLALAVVFLRAATVDHAPALDELRGGVTAVVDIVKRLESNQPTPPISPDDLAAVVEAARKVLIPNEKTDPPATIPIRQAG